VMLNRVVYENREIHLSNPFFLFLDNLQGRLYNLQWRPNGFHGLINCKISPTNY
jgi:hypothetical protein